MLFRSLRLTGTLVGIFTLAMVVSGGLRHHLVKFLSNRR